MDATKTEIQAMMINEEITWRGVENHVDKMSEKLVHTPGPAISWSSLVALQMYVCFNIRFMWLKVERLANLFKSF